MTGAAIARVPFAARTAALLATGLLAGCSVLPPAPVVGPACPAVSAEAGRPAGMEMTVRSGGASMNLEGPGLKTDCSNSFGWARCGVSGPLLAVLDSPAGRTAYDIPADRRATITYASGQNRCVLN